VWYQALFAYFSAIPVALSLLFVDIGPFSFKDMGTSGIRVVSFDTTKQLLVSLHYIPLPHKRATKRKAFETDLFATDFEGTVTLKPGFNPKHMALRTFGTIKGGTQLSPLPPMCHPLKVIQQLPSRDLGTHKVSITYQTAGKPESRTFQCLSPSQSSNRKERGVIGELVTDLTFLSLGFVKINGQNLSGQGLDGIFFHPQTGILVLTESKCRNEAKSAAKYLSDDLSEAKIVARLHEIDAPKTRELLITYVDQHMAHTFKLAQRLTPKGFVESAFGPLDPVLYIYYRYPDLSKAPQPVKMLFLETLLKRLHITLPQIERYRRDPA
jgi:hypothetical protein